MSCSFASLWILYFPLLLSFIDGKFTGPQEYRTKKSVGLFWHSHYTLSFDESRKHTYVRRPFPNMRRGKRGQAIYFSDVTSIRFHFIPIVCCCYQLSTSCCHLIPNFHSTYTKSSRLQAYTNTMTITLIDARSDSLTVSWPATEGVAKYVLEYKTEDDDEFLLLSDKLSQPQARKRNLAPGKGYFFRVAAAEEGERSWMTHPEPFACLPTDQDEKSMAAPKVANAGSNQAFHISWSKVTEESESYELQMRENQGGEEWKTIAASLSGTEVRKKNLTSKFGYQFRVRPASGDVPFSPPSEVMVARGLSQGIQRFFSSLDDGTLLRSGQQEPIPLADSLGGKEFVLLYASAHWCPPCRQYTPMLANWYKLNRKHAEVVFLSCDHDAGGFKSYFASHPWMAVDYDDDARESLIAAIRVSGIPRLVVLSGKTGRILVDNAVGQPLDVNTWRSLDK